MGIELGAVEADYLVAAECLGHVQRVVCGLHEIFAVSDPWVRPRGHPTTQRAAKRDGIASEEMLLYFLTRAFREGHGGVEYGAREDGHELFPAVAADPVYLTDGLT